MSRKARETNAPPKHRVPVDQRLALTYDDAAGLMSVSKWKIAQLVEEGKLPVKRLGSLVRIRRRDIDRLLDLPDDHPAEPVPAHGGASVPL
ncbi:excisionase family DNA-binding protein [Nocardia transvalensis]|uniref:excisionase family DNA-binding protein n=1 Tax=Nocardia transvalensis TaxID=37333 RepID=UPI0018940F46|nr:excisionase family DNA-binding protein [Nocardia transvalensis]MBF6332307.1 excisionase family DNA-binding protein [Nocardia transvalensis]